jgi:integrase
VASKRPRRRTRSGAYQDSIYVKLPDGTRRREWFTAPTLRELAKEKQRRLAERDKKPRQASRAMTVADLAELFTKRHVDIARTKTQEMYRNALIKRIAPHLFATKLRDLTVERVEEWMADLASERRPVRDSDGNVVHGSDGLPLLERVHGDVSINAARATLVVMLNKGLKWGYVAENTAQRATKIKIGRKQASIYTPAQVQQIADAMRDRRLQRIGKRGSQGEARERMYAERDHAMVMVMAFTGVRIGELLALRWMDVLDDEIVVRHTVEAGTGMLKQPKSGNQRTLPKLEPVAVALERWKRYAHRQERHDFIFSANSAAHRPLDQHGWRNRVFIPGVAVAGYPEARPHDMRHTFASLMIAKSVSPVTLAEWLGHSDPTITMRVYAQRFAAVESNVVDSVNASIRDLLTRPSTTETA